MAFQENKEKNKKKQPSPPKKKEEENKSTICSNKKNHNQTHSLQISAGGVTGKLVKGKIQARVQNRVSNFWKARRLGTT